MDAHLAVPVDTPETGGDRELDDLLRAIAHAPPRSAPPEPAPGTRWGADGRYTVERRLGRGGMGTVYAAFDSLLQRTVALKVLDAGKGDDGEGRHRERLLREARVAASVEHERIARVYDVGEHDGFLFVAMELLRGVTLRVWMTERVVPAGEVMTAILQIAEGLSELHGRGIVHRDLKPENAMFSATGGIKLLDFGLARDAGPPDGAPPNSTEYATAADRSTQGLSGTPGYMAPEQYRGETVGLRADVFALGVVVHELVTGERPFRGESLVDLRRATLEGAPLMDSPEWRRLPGALRDVVIRMLAPAADARFPDGGAALEALRGVEALFRSPSEPAGRLSVRARRRMIAGLIGVVVVGVAALGVFRVAREKAYERALAAPPPSRMALINVGTVTLGRTKEQVDTECARLGARCERERLEWQVPAARVKVPPFYLDAYEVTNAEMAELLTSLRGSLHIASDDDGHAQRYVQFDAALAHPGQFLIDLVPRGGIDHRPDGNYEARAGWERLPAAQVSWYGADVYCKARGKRLPTENEWEAAARGTTDRPYPWGDGGASCGGVIVPSDGYAPMDGTCPPWEKPVLVGTAAQDVTAEGVHDLGGNVVEWVASPFVRSGRFGLPTNDVDAPKVIRGGSYLGSRMSRTSARYMWAPNADSPNLGFRCAADFHPETVNP